MVLGQYCPSGQGVHVVDPAAANVPKTDHHRHYNRACKSYLPPNNFYIILLFSFTIWPHRRKRAMYSLTKVHVLSKQFQYNQAYTNVPTIQYNSRLILNLVPQYYNMINKLDLKKIHTSRIRKRRHKDPSCVRAPSVGLVFVVPHYNINSYRCFFNVKRLDKYG